MRSPLRPVMLVSLLILAASTAAAEPGVIEREFQYPSARFSLVTRDGETLVEMTRAGREFTPGRPDLPVVSEMIDLPPGERVAGIEVVSLETELLSGGLRVPTSIRARHGLGPVERTDPDPAFYGRVGYPPPSEQVELGYQGWMRGRHVAALRVNPVRWDAASGRAERIARMTVRIRLEPDAGGEVVERERVVPEWEDDPAFWASQPVASPSARGPAQPFKPTQLPSVLGSPVAYVIVTTDALAAEFQRLADWKTEGGVPAVVRTLSFIRQQYPFGTDDADRIRQFLRDAYGRWGTKWVLLGGDTEVIPHRDIFTTFFAGKYMPCDAYFSCLDGNWNADGDSTYGEGYYSPSSPGDACDLLPEVYVGRAPVVSVADVQRFVNRNFQYTRTPVGDYEHTIMFFAEVLFPQNWSTGQPTSLDGAELVEDVLPSLQTNPALHYTRLYQNYTDSRWEPGAYPETAANVLDSLDAGYNMAIHVGHGYRNVMSAGDQNIENADVTGLTNGNRLTNVYAVDCESNAIDFPCMGEALMNAPNGGAVTSIGSTTLDFPHAGRQFKREYFRLMFEDSVSAVGEAQARQKVPFASASQNDNINRWTYTTLVLLGDPELHQWTGTPRTLTVSHPPSFALSDTAMLVNVKIGGQPLYGARVTLYKPGDDYRSVTTDGAGNALVEFRPGSTGTFYVTVTAYDSRPRQDTLTVGPAAAAVLADLAPIIDDDAVGGTSGNANTLFDAGEVVDIKVPVTNSGGATSTAVNGVLSTTDGTVSITDADVAYGTIAPSATANGTGAFRLTVPHTCPDQREIPFRLDLVDGQGRHFVQRFTITVRAPDPRHFSHVITDVPGDGDGVPEPGETVTFAVRLRNLGTGSAPAVTVKLRNHDGLATVTDSTASFGTIAPGAEVQGDALVYSPTSTAAKLELLISTSYGLMSTQTIDLVRPATPTTLMAAGSQTSISINWAHSTAPDLAGYNIYRSNSAAGPFTRITAVPTDRTSYYQDEGLTPLTRYYYRASAVDSSGNESLQSSTTDASTNPPYHAVFPIEMRRATPAPVAIDHVYPATMLDIVAGSDVLWLWRADGTAPVDGDGTAVSHGDFTTRGSYYAAGASIAKLDGTNRSIIAPSWDSAAVYVFDNQGNVRPGWPFSTSPDAVWSGVAVGDLDNNGSKELVFASNGNRFFVLRSDGTEWIDGDANPGTPGVFKVLGSPFNYGTPALADLDANGQLDIVYAAFEGKLYAWRPNGSNLPNFPVNIGAGTTGSVAIGYLDGPGDAQLDIVVTSANDSVYVFKADGGRRTGFPIGIRVGGTSKNPSPVIADMPGQGNVLDGYNDVIVAGTDGKIHVYDRNGVINPNFVNVRYSAITDGYASESSPVVADISGDGLPDVVMGDESGVLNGISGTGQVLPGFPIQLGGEVRGTPAVCDCDADGMSEIVVSSWDKKTYVWDYDFPFSVGVIPPWPQFHHDALRTGLATNPVFVDVAPGGELPPPVVGALLPPQPNPAREAARIAWAIPAGRAGEDLDLSMYDLAGRRLVTFATGTAREGRFAIDWDLRAENDTRVGAGIYFLRFRLGPTTLSRKLVVMP